jgi:phosphinothricin acetyltransferase
MSNKISIRDCNENDIQSIADIYNYFILKEGDLVTFEEAPVTKEIMLERFISKTLNGFPFIVAVNENDFIVGYSYASTYKERTAYRFSCEDSIYIHPNHQCKGIGTILLKELLSKLEKIGIKQVVAVLGTKQDNPGSYTLHTKFGFENVGIYKNIGFKFGKWVDRLHMQFSFPEKNDHAIENNL